MSIVLKQISISQRNTKMLMAMTVFTNLGFIIPVIVPYYKDVAGLSFQDFLLGEMVFAAVVLSLEVPTGWVSDVFKRRLTLLIGVFFALLGHAYLMISDSLIDVMIAQGIIGIAVSFISGTNMALLYDSLLVDGRTDEYRKYEGKRIAMMFYAVAFGSVVGAYLYTLNPYLPLALTLIGEIIAMICIVRMIEPERHKKRPEKHPLRDMVDSVSYSLKGHANVGALILYGAILFSATKIIMWSQQPYYMAASIDEKWFGVFMAVGFMLAGTSSHLAHHFDRWVNDRIMLIGAWFLAVLLVMIASFAPVTIGIAALMIRSCIYGLCGPRVSDLINRSVPSARRATILSTASLGSSLVFMPVSAVIGYVTDQSGIRDGLLTMGLWLLGAGMIILIIANLKSRRALKLKSIL